MESNSLLVTKIDFVRVIQKLYFTTVKFIKFEINYMLLCIGASLSKATQKYFL